MTGRFIQLQWKQFFRSKYWQKSLALNLLLAFLALYFAVSFMMLGFGLYKVLEEAYPEQDVLVVANTFVFYWVLADLMIRFFLQKLPTISVKPLLTLPLKKSKIVHFALGKSVVSFFNVLPLFVVLPFAFTLIGNGYDSTRVWLWVVAMIMFSLIINFLNFLIESKTSKSEWGFVWFIAVLGALFSLSYFNLLSFNQLFGQFLIALTTDYWQIGFLVVVLAGLYVMNYKSLLQSLYLDESLHIKSKEAMTSEMAWTRNLGSLAPFVRMDLKMILRNKRTRSSVFILLIAVLYGLFFYNKTGIARLPGFLVFAGVFITGAFLINYGQFVPAWDSAYYKFIMSQNISYKTYLKSKYVLMVSSVLIVFILTIPYVYFGWDILLINFATAVFNAGVSVYIMLYAGSFNRKKIDLDRPAAFNYQGTGAVQWLIGFPLFLLPVLVFYLPYKLISFEAGIASLIICGLLGLILHKQILNRITKQYQHSKYKMIAAFSEEE